MAALGQTAPSRYEIAVEQFFTSGRNFGSETTRDATEARTRTNELLSQTVRCRADEVSDEEFEQVKLHPTLGEKIVGQIPQLVDTLPGIRSHHERFDGRGYPDGLAGQSIPLMARILAIADTYDAITSDRPYRKGLDVAVALQEVKSGAGSQFDPELAEVFVTLMLPLADQAAA